MNERDPDDLTFDPRLRGDERVAVETGRCLFFRDRLQSYIDLELDDSTLGLVAAHLRECASCRREKDALELERRQLLELMVPSPQLSDRFAERVMAGLERPRRRLWSTRFALGAAAGLLFGSISAAILAIILNGGSAGSGDPLAGGPSHVTDPVPARETSHAELPADTPIAYRREAESRSSLASGLADFPGAFFDGVFRHFSPADAPCSNDLNEDSSVDVADVAFALAALGRSDLPPGLSSWDEDCSGVVDCRHPHEI